MVPKARRWAIVALVVLLAGVPAHAQARIDSDTIDRVGSSVVRVSAWIKKTENGVTTDDYRTVGSGTLVRGDGVILTSYHVIDLDALKSALTAEEENARRNRVEISLTLQDRFAIWVPNSFGDTPAVSYTAEVVPEASDSQLDLAVVRIAAGPRGQPLGSHVVDLPAVRLGDSDRPL